MRRPAAWFLLAVSALILAACGGGTSPSIGADPPPPLVDSSTIDLGPHALPADQTLIAQWLVGRAQNVALVTVLELLPAQWNVDPSPADLSPLPADAVIFRDALVQLDDPLLHDALPARFYVRLLGGTVAGRTLTAPDQPSLIPGRQHLLYLEQTRDERLINVRNRDDVAASYTVLGGTAGARALGAELSAREARDAVGEIVDATRNPGMLTCTEEHPLLAELIDTAELVVIATAAETTRNRCVSPPDSADVPEDALLPVSDTPLGDVVALKGEAPPDLIYRQPGGDCDGIALTTEFSIQLAPGQRYLLFLSPSPFADDPNAFWTPVVLPPAALFTIHDFEPDIAYDRRSNGVPIESITARIEASP